MNEHVLNLTLYNALVRRFGHVRVGMSGVEINWSEPFVPPLSRSERLVRTVYSRGEHYQVNCPYCGDTRFRLYFGYWFGARDPGTR